MKRLKKKAWETIVLYHHTSSQAFMKMMEEGVITPGGYNGNIAGGGHEKYVDVVNENNPQNNTVYSLSTLDSWINGKEVNISQKLINLVNQKKEENPDGWQDEEIEINISYPSGNEIGVYLSSDEMDGNNYSSEAIRLNSDGELLNLKTTLKLEVQTDALSPDYDDLKEDLDKDSSEPLWKQSLDLTEQCVHNGPIDINSIISVTFTDMREQRNLASKFNGNIGKFKEFAFQFLEEDFEMSASEAYNQLLVLNEAYSQLGNEVNANNNESRLKRGIKK